MEGESISQNLDLTNYFVTPDNKHRWQGDVYSTTDFNIATDTPTFNNIKYWMLMNRTCQLVEGNGREVKIPRLVYCPVIELEQFFGVGKVSKNKLSHLLSGKADSAAFLPAGTPQFPTEAVVDFGAVTAFNLSECPAADKKKVQLASPYNEYLMQRFAQYYVTVGYDDGPLRDDNYIKGLVEKYSKE